VGDYTAPKDSKNYKKLLEFVANHERGSQELADSLREVLFSLNVPGTLLRFGWITRRLNEWLQNFEKLKNRCLVNLPGHVQFVLKLKRWISWYLAYADEVIQIMPNNFDAGPGKDIDPNPMSRHGMTRHGLYAALFCVQYKGRSKAEENWNLLALRYLFVHACLMQRWAVEAYEQYEGVDEALSLPVKLYPSSKDLRLLSGDKFFSIFAELDESEVLGSGDIIGSGGVTLELWLDYRHQSTDGKLGKKSANPIDDSKLDPKAIINSSLKMISRLLEFIFKYESGRGDEDAGGGNQNQQPSGIPHINQFGHGHVAIDTRVSLEEVYCDIDDPWTEDQPIHNVVAPKQRKGELEVKEDQPEELERSGLLPREFDDGDVLSLVDACCEDTRKSVTSIALAARARQKHLAMQAQMLRWRYSSLTFQQLKLLDKFLQEEVKLLAGAPEDGETSRAKLRELNAAELLRYESLLLMSTMLWTGSRLERAVGVTMLHYQVKENESLLGIYMHEDTQGSPEYEWRFKALEPTYQTNPKLNLSVLRKRNSSFWLPDVGGVVKNLVHYCNKYLDGEDTGKLFDGQEEGYRQGVTKIIKEELNKTLIGEGITLHKIESFLFQHIVNETADVTSASIITGQAHYASSVKIFYTTPTLNTLRTVYKKSIVSALAEVAGQSDLPGIHETKDFWHTGARYCVKKCSYRWAIRKVRAKLHKKVNYSTWSEFSDFHNTYTFYVVLAFGFATAARAIRSPLIKASDIDEAGLSTFADKDYDPPYHARMIWVPEWVKDQVADYSRHLEAVVERLIIKYPSEEYKHRDLPCFFLDESGQMLPVSPLTLTPFYSKFIDVPANSHRRFLRTELTALGMPIESVDMLMGHWSNGEEPWGPFSSFHVPKHIKNLQYYLEPLLEELGFKGFTSRTGVLT